AYNDFLSDYCAEDPKRLIALTAVPFWDIERAAQEIERCANMGHRGILFTHAPDSFGQPFFGDPHWTPLWEVCQEIGLPVNFHIGSGNVTMITNTMQWYAGNGLQTNTAKSTAQAFLSNAHGVMEVIGSGVCHRYPRLNFVSVESGVGWIPFVLESMNW